MTPRSDRVRVGIIGCGYWGPNLVRNFSETPSVEVTWLCDLDRKRTEALKPRAPWARTTRDPRDLFRDPSLDAVAVATPLSTHFALASAALEAGKHVLVEKPMAASTDECRRLIDLAERRRKVLQVDHTFVYTGAVRKMKEIHDRKGLGKILYLDSVRVNLGLFQHDINVIWDLAPHDLSIMDHVLGKKVLAVSATGACHSGQGMENIAYVTLFFRDDVIAHLHVNWLAPVKIRRMLLGGSERMLVFDDMETSEKIKIYDRGITVGRGDAEGIYRTLIQYRMGDMHAPKVDNAEALKQECAHFIECVTSGGRPLTDAASGLRVVQVLEAAEKSVKQKGKLIHL